METVRKRAQFPNIYRLKSCPFKGIFQSFEVGLYEVRVSQVHVPLMEKPLRGPALRLGYTLM